MTMKHDLLNEPLLAWRDSKRQVFRSSLPELLSLLGHDKVQDFPRVRAHQYAPWEMFLTQLAAAALMHSGEDPKHARTLDEAQWREKLLNLTKGEHEPWNIYVKNLSKAAFFQPPVPESSKEKNFDISNKWKSIDSPDDLDVLVTSKAHDVKTSMMDPADPELWIYALVTTQTTEGYPGRGYSPIARMNGSYGNRPRIGLAKNLRPGSRFTRDLNVLTLTWNMLAANGKTSDNKGFGYNASGESLVWTIAWDGVKSLRSSDLAPHFIEICRRVRFVEHNELLYCYMTTANERRCDLGTEKGDIGDPWIPIRRGDASALTIAGKGFDYSTMCNFMFGGEFEPAIAQEYREEDGDFPFFIGQALSRGQGKTDGLHERILPLPPKVTRLMGSNETRDTLRVRAEEFVKTAKDMRQKVVYPALKTLSSNSRISDEFDRRVDDHFFQILFTTLDLAGEEATLRWSEKLLSIAKLELENAINRTCTTDAGRYKVIVNSESMFWGCIRKNFPELVLKGAKSNE